MWYHMDANGHFRNGAGQDPVSKSEAIRQRLGAHFLLGLEIFIAADIISSAVSPSWEKVGILATIVGVRAVLSYFLMMELKQGARLVLPQHTRICPVPYSLSVTFENSLKIFPQSATMCFECFSGDTNREE